MQEAFTVARAVYLGTFGIYIKPKGAYEISTILTPFMIVAHHVAFRRRAQAV